jgi:hypothetical protein
MCNDTAQQVRSFDAEKVETTLAERRARPRHQSCQFALSRYRPEPESTCQLVRVWNVSTNSVGLFLSQPMKPGTVFHLQFRHLVVQDRLATAVHVTEEEGNWLVGCELDHPFNAIELQALRQRP